MANVLPTEGSKALLDLVIRRLKEAGLADEAAVDAKIQVTDAGDWRNGARMIARAWVDPGFKALLLSDGLAAVREIGYKVTAAAPLGVLENTPEQHNLVVCTLCSCYPRWLLGYPPSWYKSEAYRARAVREPRELLREWGLGLPPETEIQVVDSTADYRWIVLPLRPEGTEGWTEEQLMELITPESIIGADVCVTPAH